LIGLGDEEQWIKLGHGYFDDACDGIIELRLAFKGRDDLRAYARFASAVPNFAPDSLPVRSIADDLEQLVFGPVVDPNDPLVKRSLRRALETVRLMNTVVANGTQASAVWP